MCAHLYIVLAFKPQIVFYSSQFIESELKAFVFEPKYHQRMLTYTNVSNRNKYCLFTSVNINNIPVIILSGLHNAINIPSLFFQYFRSLIVSFESFLALVDPFFIATFFLKTNLFQTELESILIPHFRKIGSSTNSLRIKHLKTRKTKKSFVTCNGSISHSISTVDFTKSMFFNYTKESTL